MMKNRTLGKLFGVEVKIHGTFLILLAFLAISGLLNGGPWQAALSLGLSVIVFSIVVAHEFGHILAARRFGYKTRDVILSPLGGMARLEGVPSTPSQEIAIAAAGPAVNLVLAGLGYALQPMVSSATTMGALLGALTGWFVTINLALFLFNLIPALPMDGGRILRALLSKPMGRVRATEVAARVARWSALLMAIYAVGAGQWTLLFIAGFVFVASWMEVFQANVMAAQQNPAYQVFRAFQEAQGGGVSRGSGSPDGSYSARVVDQDGRPVNGGGESQSNWRVTNVRWVE